MPLQLTPTGIETKTRDEIRQDLVNRVKTRFGVGARTEPGSVFGDLIDVFIPEYEDINNLALDLYNAFSRTAAEGASLDSLGAVVGAVRQPAIPSTAPGEITGTNGTVVPAGTRVRIPGGSIWEIQAEVTISGTTAVVLESEENGPVEAASGTITEIVDPVVGWSTVTNTDDASLGQLAASDSQYRRDIQSDLSRGSSSSEKAIRSALLGINGIAHASVKSNRNVDPVDADGIPLNKYRAVVLPPTLDPKDVVLVLWKAQPVGIDSFGSESETVIDDQGFTQTINFDFGSELDMYVDLNLTKAPTGFPLDGDDQVKQAVVDYGNALDVGGDVYPTQIACAIIAAVAGLLDVEVFVDVTASPTNQNPISIDTDEIAVFATSRVTIL